MSQFIMYHLRWCSSRHDSESIAWIGASRVHDACGGVEAVDVDLPVLPEQLVDSIATVDVVPSFVAVEIAAVLYDSVGLVGDHRVAPRIVHEPNPVLRVASLRIPQLTTVQVEVEN